MAELLINNNNISKNESIASNTKENAVAEELERRKEKAFKTMNYLLSNSQKYSSFFLKRLQTKIETQKRPGRKPLQENIRNNNMDLDKEQIDELKKRCGGETSEKEIDKASTIKQPMNFIGKLQTYQLEGLVWLKLLFENSVNGILADEMGLGKTIQVIALICDLMEQQIGGPFLIIVPLSTLPNWISEFKRFAPKIHVVKFHGNKEERRNTYEYFKKKYIFDNNYETSPVIITPFGTILQEVNFLRQFNWQYVIVDEGQKMKNYKSKLFRDVKSLTSSNRLILTGTPLQNNLVELWSLLNFLLPQFFNNVDTFESIFLTKDFEQNEKILEQEQSTNVISTIQGILNPFMLRRLKCDVLIDLPPKKEVLVYCPMSELQRDLYRFVLQKNIDKLLGKEPEPKEAEEGGDRKRRKCSMNVKYSIGPEESDVEVGESITSSSGTEPEESSSSETEPDLITNKDQIVYKRRVLMGNPSTILRQIVNHPFCIQMPVKKGTNELIIDEEIIRQSGKLMVLDAMLVKLIERKHKVLLFCTSTMILDFIEDFVELRNIKYCRLDGSSKLLSREETIDEFNTNPEIPIFLISTRAGGVGLNLTAADTVIMFDSDWNPQVDIQAQNRCHRIGQTKPVVVYTFILKGTIDEHILKCATAKRKLEKVIIQKGKFTSPERALQLEDLENLEKLLNSINYTQTIQSNGYVLTNEELDNLLDRTDLYKEIEEGKQSFLDV